MTTAPDIDGPRLIAQLEVAHRAEDVRAYVDLFRHDAVWVTGRGICFRGRPALEEYLHGVMPGGLEGGSVDYRIESVTALSPEVGVVVVDQVYVDHAGQPKPTGRHTHTYVIVSTVDGARIAAGQNTARAGA